MENKIKYYNGRIPACGVFCGGCPVYTREKKTCPGAEINIKKCENCKTFHQCCQNRGITHCYQCPTFPCYKLRSFASRWFQYGQDLVQNQYLLMEKTEEEFRNYYNSKAE